MFHAFTHFLYGPSQMTRRTMFPIFHTRIYANFMQSIQKCKISSLLFPIYNDVANLNLSCILHAFWYCYLFCQLGIKWKNVIQKHIHFPVLPLNNFPWFYAQFIQLYTKYPGITYNTFMFLQFSVHIHCLHNWGFCYNSAEHFSSRAWRQKPMKSENVQCNCFWKTCKTNHTWHIFQGSINIWNET